MHFGSYYGRSQDVSAASSKASQAKLEVEFMRQEVDRILMINEALWEIIKETNHLDKDLLYKKMIEIDGRDGKVDGKVAKNPPKHCAKCNQVLPKGKPFCFYCGNKSIGEVFER